METENGAALAEILKNIRRIEIVTRRLVNDVFSGEYHSVFKGQGMEFDEVREYQPGDDVRMIDWNVTARTGVPFVKRFVEERELLVFFLLDVSASGRFGSSVKTKVETAAEICSLLAFSALENNDKVGAITFSGEIEEYIPPDKGRKHVLRVIRELLFYQPRGKKTDIRGALRFLLRVVKRRAIVFILSDFITSDFSHELALAAGKYDLIALNLADRRELELPNGRLARLWDQEEGVERVVDLGSSRARRLFNLRAGERRKNLKRIFNKNGADIIDIAVGEDYIKPLSIFFRSRAKRR